MLMKLQLANQPVLQKFRRIDDMALNRNLLKRLEIHKEKTLVVVVQVLVFAGLNPDGVNFHPRIKGVINHLSRLKVF